MSYPDPLYDPENSCEDDEMFTEPDESDVPFAEYLYDDHNDFYQECEDYNDYYIEENEVEDDDDYDDSMDGDHESGLASCGWGTDEDYGHYGDYDREDFHADESVGFVDYYEDGPYED